MGKGTLTIFSASAGSGKTYTLTEIYLINLFRSRHYYRRILAVTFTNKSTAEMKSRILDNLHRLANGNESPHLDVLIKSTGWTEESIRKEAGEILNSLLHDYSRFSISTIDSFFQRILRAFAREAGLNTGFNIELDHSVILASAVDEMIESAVEGSSLNRWLTSYALSNIAEERSWNMKEGIMKLSQELFRESFKIFSADDRKMLSNKEFLNGYIETVRTITRTFENNLAGYGKRAADIFAYYNLSEDMFYRKGQGVPGYIRSLAEGNVKEPNSWVREVKNTPPRWATSTVAHPLQSAIDAGLGKLLPETIDYYDTNIRDYKTAKVILSNIFALGILSDVLQHIHLITTTENTFLLSDAGDLLNQITGEDQSPFIYEKVGNRYDNFMIDEFQDTSMIQWNNLKSLIDNSMAEGSDNLVVGDVKQSIYRWRNSDWRILGVYLNSLIDNDRYLSRPLIQNWRSRSNIIRFNNQLFTNIPCLLDQQLSEMPGQISFREIYSEAVQSDPRRDKEGYVRIEFIEDQKEDSWQVKVLALLPGLIESLQDGGFEASDIGILVRDSREGSAVMKTIIDYSNTVDPVKRIRYNYNVVSADSLLLSNSHAVNFIIAVLSVVNDPDDMISRALMLRLYLLSKNICSAEKVLLAAETIDEQFRVYFPEGYDLLLGKVRQLPLFEAVENIIGFFGLGQEKTNVAFLNTLQDHVLGFTGNKSGDIQSFLDWWAETGGKKSVIMPGNQDATRILTIHKSKGLEFSVVILPFLNWNLDHMSSKQPFIWVRPQVAPFSELRTVPVRYSAELENTHFAADYYDEKHSVFVDNINLLYVALTRARDAIFAFAANNPRVDNSVGAILKKGITFQCSDNDAKTLVLSEYLDETKKIFEFGKPAEKSRITKTERNPVPAEYSVSNKMDSLRLKLHGESYLTVDNSEKINRINYGKLMHEVFESIRSREDISSAVSKLVMEGKLPVEESSLLQQRIESNLSSPLVADWFAPGNEIMTEAEILLPGGNTRRPDRIIFRDGKILIVDFKFGEESAAHNRQVEQYRELLKAMGYKDIEAFIWYVEKNRVVTV